MSRMRNWFSSAGLVVAGVALLAFLAGSVLWFIRAAKDDGTIAAGNAFVGLGYMAGALVIVLLAIVGLRMLAGAGTPRRRTPVKTPRPRRGGDEHAIIRMQLAWGSTLVIVGAIVGLLCLCILHGSADGPVLALATAVISAGAVLLPAGAAGGASARLLQQQTATGGAPTQPHAPEVTRTSDTSATLRGTVSPTAQDVEAYFEYQDMPAEDATGAAPVAQAQPTHRVSAGAAAQSVTNDLTTLDPAKAYQVRLVVKSASGATATSDWSALDTFTAPDTSTTTDTTDTTQAGVITPTDTTATETETENTDTSTTDTPDGGGESEDASTGTIDTGEAEDTSTGTIDTGEAEDTSTGTIDTGEAEDTSTGTIDTGESDEKDV